MEDREEYRLNTRLLTYSIKVSTTVSNKVRKLGIDTEVAGMIITNLLACIKKNQILLYSRMIGKSSAKVTKYNRKGITVPRVIKTVDKLVEAGLICNFVGKAHKELEKRQMSFIAPTDKFVEEFCSDPEQAMLAISAYNAALQTIILRNEFGVDIDYQDDANIKKARQIVQKLNEINESHEIRDGEGNLMTNIYCRVFNKDMQHGGRFFHSDALKLKNKVSKSRLDITIDGNPVLEIDFRNLHYRIAAVLEGYDDSDLPQDVYMEILPEELRDSYHREIVKLAINILFNAKSEKSADKAIQDEIKKVKENLHPSFHSGKMVRLAVYDATPEFKSCYCREDSFGLALQNADSWLAQRVIERFIAVNRPILPIHDSFVVDRNDVGLLISAMSDSFREEFGVTYNVQLKMSVKNNDIVEEDYIVG